jgi:hypothetical protein
MTFLLNHGSFLSGVISTGKPCNCTDLSAVLENGEVPVKYFLSKKACKGILRRAAKRGKKLPAHLEAALMAAAGATTPTERHSSNPVKGTRTSRKAKLPGR